MVGADGAHSEVRRALDIGVDGSDEGELVTTAVFRAPLWDLAGERRYGLYSTQADSLLPEIVRSTGRFQDILYALALILMLIYVPKGLSGLANVGKKPAGGEG